MECTVLCACLGLNEEFTRHASALRGAVVWRRVLCKLTLCSMFGAALVDLLTELVTLNYLGEIPAGTAIMVRPSTNMHVVFVVLSTTGVCASPTEHYTAVRAALLRIRSHNYDLALGRAPAAHYLDEALRQQEHAIRHLVLSDVPALGCSEAGVARAVALAYKSLSSPVRVPAWVPWDATGWLRCHCPVEFVSWLTPSHTEP